MRRLLPFAVLLAILSCSAALPQRKGTREATSPAPPPAAKQAAAKAANRDADKDADGDARPLVCIDPGHPSEVSSGGEMQNGTSEVHIAWEVASRLKAMLEEAGYRVVLTKEREGQVVENRRRAQIANEAKAALMVRLHCDASNDSGYALYYPDRQGTTQGTTGPAPRVMESSRLAAEALHAGMAEVLGGALKDGGVRGDSKTLVGSRQGALTGSIFSEVPVVTVEMVVLSNAADAAFIKAEAGQDAMARAIAAGVTRFLPPPREGARREHR